MDSLLRFAIQNQKVKLVELHIGRGVDLDEVDANGKSALVLAAEVGSKEIFRMLLDAGASPVLSGCQFPTLAAYLKANGLHTLLQILEEYTPPENTPETSDRNRSGEEESDWDERFDAMFDSDWDFISTPKETSGKDFRDDVLERTRQSQNQPQEKSYTQDEVEIYNVLSERLERKFEKSPIFTQDDVQQLELFFSFATETGTIPEVFVRDLCQELLLPRYARVLFRDWLAENGIVVTTDDLPEILDWFDKRYRRHVHAHPEEMQTKAVSDLVNALSDAMQEAGAEECAWLSKTQTTSVTLLSDVLDRTLKDVVRTVCRRQRWLKIFVDLMEKDLNANRIRRKNKQKFEKRFRQIITQIGTQLAEHDDPSATAPWAESLLVQYLVSLTVARRIMPPLIQKIAQTTAPDSLSTAQKLMQQLDKLQQTELDILAAMGKYVQAMADIYSNKYPGEHDDFLSAALQGAVDGVQCYDCSVGAPIQPYASARMYHIIHRYFTENMRLIRIPTYVYEQQSIPDAENDAQCLPFPELDEWVSLSEMSAEELERFAIQNQFWYDLPVPATDQQEVQKAIDSLTECLEPHNKELIYTRFGIGDQEWKTLEEVATLLRITRERVRQKEAQCLRRLRRHVLDLPSTTVSILLECCEE